MSEHPDPNTGPRRARTAADHRLLALAREQAIPQINELLTEISTEASTALGLPPRAIKTALIVLLESGMLTDHVGRVAALNYEIDRGEQGVSAQAAHTELADPLGMTRQGIEQRLSLVGAKPGRRGTASADDLREYIRKDRAKPRQSAPTSSSEQSHSVLRS